MPQISDNTREEIRHHSKRLGREIAMQFLYSCEMQEQLPGAAAFEAFFETAQDVFELSTSRLERRAREYASQLYEVTAVNMEKIDGIIADNCRNWDFDRISGVDRNILRVAVAEMCFIPEIPAIVSIDEAVGIARDYSGCESGNFVNGILNAIKNQLPEKK